MGVETGSFGPYGSAVSPFWTVIGALLVIGLGLIVWGSMSGPDPSGRDLSERRSTEMRVGAVLVSVSLLVLVVAYLTADWP